MPDSDPARKGSRGRDGGTGGAAHSGGGNIWAVAGSAAALIVLLIYLGLTNGEFNVPASDMLRTLLRMQNDADQQLVIFQFRLPRILLGALVGLALGAAGAAVQSVTRNSLADPGILGINAGAGMAVVLFMLVFQDLIGSSGTLGIMLMPLFGVAGGMAAALTIFSLARSKGSLDPQRLILVGIAVTTGFGAVTLYASLKMNPSDFERAAMWLSGNLNAANWTYILSALPWVAILIPVLWSKARLLDLLRLGDDSLASLGISLGRERGRLLLASVGLVAASVAVSGSIAFVGLIAPHMASRLIGMSHRRIVPVSSLIGCAMVLAGDFVGRTVFSPSQLPVGIVISIIGAPYFVWLLAKQRRHG
ncbi:MULTISPECIES: iron ABC transporter permease [unclassified Paenibacillus]|uniref:FecCD family ABC transporter permease n=1 Tax=unclassified Paenibacillus TaxID=185978 RepID=UPI0009558099|nr:MULTISPECIES: iron ABC transporter permease [unclassified Paenibacillus]ASS67812.1 iron ABC transporter permease [Paenibacillus sp. RUD330]SIR60212.1 iron complex transport system permease protein [Paenibacillus sp. RU4X]SIR69070.1 iron complex transport system permease protein [Paenibacillus sp. RU4T]